MDRTGDTIFKPAWLLPLRMTTFIIVSGVVIFGLKYPNFLRGYYLIYSLVTLALPAVFIFRKWMNVDLLLRFFPFLQSLCEIAVVMGIVYTTGSINSAFSGLFILTIISTALVSSLAGTLGIASIVSISYAIMIWFSLEVPGQPGSSRKALESIFSSQDAAFYSIFLHILTFFLVAFISGFLVERLKTRDRQLADTSQALRQAKLETDDILRHLNSGLITVDCSGRIVYFNRSGEQILGYHERDIRGRDFRAVFSLRMPRLAASLEEALNANRALEREELDITDGNGHVVPLGLSTSLLRDEDGQVRGVIAIFQDLTDTKKLEEKIRQADKMAAVGELSAAIAHEIRNPMAAISGSVEVLYSELKVGGENKRLMDLIVRESGRLNDILTDFLLYARSSRTLLSRVELCRLVSDVFEFLRHHPAFHEQISFHFSSSDACVYVYSDEDQLKQVLINLMVNSCQALEAKPGEIAVSVETDISGRVVLVIADSGPGVEKDVLPRIFDPFFSTKRNGTGLGLAIVSRLAANLNIELAVESATGVGTAFILEFRHRPADSEKNEENITSDFSPESSRPPVGV